LSHFPSLKLRSRDTKLRSGKRLRFASGCIKWAAEPSSKKQAVDDEGDYEAQAGSVAIALSLPEASAPASQHLPDEGNSNAQYLNLLQLPEELLDGALVDALPMKDLCALAQSCSKFRRIALQDRRWRAFFEARWGCPTRLVNRAAELAGSWRILYAAKHMMDREALPWIKPTAFELGASVENIALNGLGLLRPKNLAALPEVTAPIVVEDPQAASERCVLFLVDGSGSVTEDDFHNMTSFMCFAWNSISFSCPSAKVGIVQFSNDVRVELQPTCLDADGFNEHVTKMNRMNGGTNISAAIRKAGQILGGTKASNQHTAIILLTDGRVDGYQATEAVDIASRLADEVPGGVSLYAFGVGRGVDRGELLRIINAGGATIDESRYLGLCTCDDAPW